MTPSCPDDTFFLYVSCLMRDQTTLTYVCFRLRNFSLKYLVDKIVSAVDAYCIYKKCAISTARKNSSIAISFKDLNDEGSHTTVFRARNNVSASVHNDPTTHRQSIWEARMKMMLLPQKYIYTPAVRSKVLSNILSCSVYFRSWLSARLAVAAKRTRSGRGHSPCSPQMADCVKISRHVSSPDYSVSRRVVRFVRSKSDERSLESYSFKKTIAIKSSTMLSFSSLHRILGNVAYCTRTLRFSVVTLFTLSSIESNNSNCCRVRSMMLAPMRSLCIIYNHYAKLKSPKMP